MMASSVPRLALPMAFGVYDEEREQDRRVTFVIDKTGTIRHVIDDRQDMERHSRESLEIIGAWA